MNKYYDLEASILCCLLLKPENMEKLTIDDKYFIKYKSILIFMREFYNKFHNFDIVLMYSVANNKNKIIESIIFLLEKEPTASMFEKYQEQIVELHKELKEEKYQIERIFELSNKLLVRNITLEDFDIEYNNIKTNTKEIFKGE